MDDRRQALNAAGVAAIPKVMSSVPPPPPAPAGGLQITLNPQLVEVFRGANLAIGRAYVASGRELVRLFAEMLQ